MNFLNKFKKKPIDDENIEEIGSSTTEIKVVSDNNFVLEKRPHNLTYNRNFKLMSSTIHSAYIFITIPVISQSAVVAVISASTAATFYGYNTIKGFIVHSKMKQLKLKDYQSVNQWLKQNYNIIVNNETSKMIISHAYNVNTKSGIQFNDVNGVLYELTLTTDNTYEVNKIEVKELITNTMLKLNHKLTNSEQEIYTNILNKFDVLHNSIKLHDNNHFEVNVIKHELQNMLDNIGHEYDLNWSETLQGFDNRLDTIIKQESAALVADTRVDVIHIEQKNPVKALTI